MAVNLGSYYLVAIPVANTVGFRSPFKREGTLDWTKCRINSAIPSVSLYNKSHGLAKTGYYSTELITYHCFFFLQMG